MPQNDKKRSKSPITAAAPGRAGAGSASTTASLPTGFEGVLLQLIQLVQKLSTPKSLATHATGQWTSGQWTGDAARLEPSAREQLHTALETLDADVALKLHSLMIAGKDQSVGSAKSEPSVTDARAALVAMADADESGSALIDYLRRGHALACAADMKLDQPLADWHAQTPRDLDERAWLSFGKQLASSRPDDWRCLGIVNPGTRELHKLYLKLGDHAWWSFQTVLDRPTLAGVETARRALAKRRNKGVSTSTLQALVGQLSGAEGRALRRASKAIYARVGHVNDAARP